MKLSIGYRPLMVISLCASLLACAGHSGETFDTPNQSFELQIEQLDERQRANLFEAIIAGDMAEFQGDFQSATSYYLFAADLSRDPSLIRKSIESAQKADDPLGTEQAAAMWLEQDPGNQTAEAYLFTAQLQQQNNIEAYATLQRVLNAEPSPEVRYQFIETNLLQQDPRLVFNILRELNGQYPKDVAVATALAKFYMNLSANNQNPQNLLRQALSKVEQALNFDPVFAPAVKVKSHTLFQLRRDNDARLYLSGLYSQYPDNVEISQMLGQLLYDLRDFEAAVAHYTDWLREHPEDLEAKFYLAASNYSLTRHQQALELFVELLNEEYQIRTVAFFCGDSAIKLKQTELAIDCFQQVDGGKYLVPAKLQLTKIYTEQGQYQAAVGILQMPTNLPESEQVKLISAEIDVIFQHIDKQQARERLEETLGRMPDNPVLLLKKIEVYELTSQPEKMIAVLNQTRELIAPGPKLDNFNLAAAALINNQGYFSQSISWLDQAIEAKPEDKDLIYTRAIYKEPLGLYDEMVSEFKYLLTLYPDDLNIQNALGYTLADQGKELDYASQLINQAYQGLPNNAAVIDSKGWLAFRQGNIAEALQFLSKAFQLMPSAEVAAHLGEVLWQDGQKDRARQVWRNGKAMDETNKVLKETLERLQIEL